jgi:hypothetical protein
MTGSGHEDLFTLRPPNDSYAIGKETAAERAGSSEMRR